MKKREFKAESKRLLDLMINSIYTNKDIFLRELISNASDAIDKLYYKSLTEKNISISKDELNIRIDIDKENRKIVISDNGCGMTDSELENNLGTIAKSGSLAFKQENEEQEDVNIIGQFGVGFYSAFMVSKSIEVLSKSYGSDKAYLWKSSGEDGYTIEEATKDTNGTTITLNIKDDTEDVKYSDYLEEYKIRSIVKKYSDYIRYPIIMKVENRVLKEGSKDEYETVIEDNTLNSMTPIWKKNKNEIKEEEYSNFYTDKFYDYEKPMKVMHTSVEGNCTYTSILFIPNHAPYDLYSKEYEKGLQLYSNDILIMDKCSELLPDYFNFVKGIVESPDLSLNISREMLQQDRKLQIIAKNIETKIKKELLDMLNDNREEYQKFFKTFGTQIKYGIYNDYGMNKEKLQDLLMFYSSNKKDYITLKEYIEQINEGQEVIYYACGETVDKIDMLPQVEQVKDEGYDILYLTEYVDEFVIKTLMNYENKNFVNICSKDVNLGDAKEKEKLEKINNKNKDMLSSMKEVLKDKIESVRFTNRLKNHPLCLTTEGDISIEMEKVINAMPTDEKIHAKTILEINENHPIAEKLIKLYKEDKDTFDKYTKILYSQARLIEGLTIENPTEISNIICELISK